MYPISGLGGGGVGGGYGMFAHSVSANCIWFYFLNILKNTFLNSNEYLCFKIDLNSILSFK